MLFRSGPAPDSAQLGASLRRGLPCRLLTTVNGAAEVMVEESDLATGQILQRYTGWIDETALATSIERRHFHLTTAQQTAPRWHQRAEGRFDFECLSAEPGLVAPQQAWFELCRPALRVSTGKADVPGRDP